MLYVGRIHNKSFIEIKKDPQSRSLKTNWCSIVDVLQTAAIDATNDYKLKHLVEIFGLSGDLLTRY